MLTPYLDILLPTLIVAFVANIFFTFRLLFKIRGMKQESVAFFTGRNGKNLESTILAQLKNVKALDGEVQELYDICRRIHAIAQSGLSKVGYLRFNPFKDVGGNQSFAIALLDGKKNGIVISSLHTKEGVRVYSKPVVEGSGVPEYPLTEEESKAIAGAHSNKIPLSPQRK